ncbi:hypothetical protein [Streptomyces sp. NPDC001356]
MGFVTVGRVNSESLDLYYEDHGGCRPVVPGLVKDLTFVTVEGGSHTIARTHPEEVDTALPEFLAK